MEDIIKKKDIIKTCNELLSSGLRIRVFGLNYEPFYEDIAITNERRNRSGFISTASGLALDVSGIISKIKVRTLTGFSRLFTKVKDGEDEYRVNLVMDNKWVKISPRDYTSIAPGMIFAMGDTNLGMITDVEPIEPEESDGNGHFINLRIVNESLQDVFYELYFNDSYTPESYILDRVIK